MLQGQVKNSEQWYVQRSRVYIVISWLVVKIAAEHVFKKNKLDIRQKVSDFYSSCWDSDFLGQKYLNISWDVQQLNLFLHKTLFCEGCKNNFYRHSLLQVLTDVFRLIASELCNTYLLLIRHFQLKEFRAT